jgi:hypothetical protein
MLAADTYNKSARASVAITTSTTFLISPVGAYTKLVPVLCMFKRVKEANLLLLIPVYLSLL